MLSVLDDELLIVRAGFGIRVVEEGTYRKGGNEDGCSVRIALGGERLARGGPPWEKSHD
jgi:hypothetical protein